MPITVAAPIRREPVTCPDLDLAIENALLLSRVPLAAAGLLRLLRIIGSRLGDLLAGPLLSVAVRLHLVVHLLVVGVV